MTHNKSLFLWYGTVRYRTGTVRYGTDVQYRGTVPYRTVQILVRLREIFTCVSYANIHCSMTVLYALRVNETVYASLRLYVMNSDTLLVRLVFFRIYTKKVEYRTARGTVVYAARLYGTCLPPDLYMLTK